MTLSEYITQNTWCNFKNNNRTLFYRSIWTHGAQKYKHSKIKNQITEDITIYYPHNTRQVRAFNGNQPMLSKETLNNYSVNDIPKAIKNYYELREKLEILERKLEKDILNYKKIKDVILTEAQIYAYEYLISGLANNYNFENNEEIKSLFNNWKNDKNNKEPWIYDKIFSSIITKYQLNIDIQTFKNYTHFQELFLCFENKLSWQSLINKIKQREKNGFLFLNFNSPSWKNKVIQRRKIVAIAKNKFENLEKNYLKKIEKDNCISGEPTFQFGTLQGECVVINNNPREMDFLGKIVVCPILTAQLIYELLDAKCIIVDNGGFLSHAAICSREYQIPCIIGCKVATHYFKTGDLLEIDGTKGKIKRISS